jgi:hypothetical protein
MIRKRLCGILLSEGVLERLEATLKICAAHEVSFGPGVPRTLSTIVEALIETGLAEIEKNLTGAGPMRPRLALVLPAKSDEPGSGEGTA